MFQSLFCTVSSAIDLLQDLAILDEREQLTLLGEKISSFGCDPRIAKALVYGAIFRQVLVPLS